MEFIRKGIFRAETQRARRGLPPFAMVATVG